MIRIRQIKIEVEKDSIDDLKNKVAKTLKTKTSEIKEIIIKKKSIDARHKDNLLFVYEVDININNEDKYLKNKDILKTPIEEYHFPKINKEVNPVIIGSGPAGLFCAYVLAEQGLKPIIFERGEKIEDRVKSVEEFWNTNKLNINSNVQFGEGGAGTFSDGKLNTLVKDKLFRGKKVFEIFIENGAPEDIMYLNKPHIGTDLLRKVIINMRNKIISKGGVFYYNSELTDLSIENNKLVGITINNKDFIKTDNIVLAIGHSARNTFEMLNKKELGLCAKPFAVGVRIEHPQEMIDISQYGRKRNNLPPASYKLTYQTTKKRGVYSFCMCPGGYVVNASSEEGLLAVNGMSNHQRESKNANSALVVTISPKDFGENPLDGLKFQRELESIAYKEGKGNIPLQLYKDYKENRISNELGIVDAVIKGKHEFSNLNKILPSYVNEALKEAIPEFGKKIKGYDMDDAILLGVESRTSSPVRIPRNEFGESLIKGIYPCGEGAGYAGGITSAAMDGIKTAELLVS